MVSRFFFFNQSAQCGRFWVGFRAWVWVGGVSEGVNINIPPNTAVPKYAVHVYGTLVRTIEATTTAVLQQ